MALIVIPRDEARRILRLSGPDRAESERLEQVALIQWARASQHLDPALWMLHAIPNGGARHITVAKKLRAEGVLAGVCDLYLPAARRGYHGLYIEMKAGHNKPTKHQQAFINGALREGYCVALCYSSDAAKEAILWYLGHSMQRPPCILA